MPNSTEIKKNLKFKKCDRFNERKGKGSKTRFINESLKEALETRQDLFNALETRDNGMLHGARHTYRDLKVYDNYIKNIENLKNL